MSNYKQCAKCGLTLQRQYLEIVVANTRGKIRQVLICKGCKAYLEKRDKQTKGKNE